MVIMIDIGVPAASATEGDDNDDGKLVDTPSKEGEFGSEYLRFFFDSSIDSQCDSFFHVGVYICCFVVNPVSTSMGDTAKGEKQSTSAKGEKKSMSEDAINQEGEFGSEYL
jgi:hypothetical protein